MAFKVSFGRTQNSKQTYFVKITDRVRPRIVQNAWGWTIDHFTDLRELLMVIRDAIKDHQRMHEHGTLHRDVSTGNILIQPLPPNSDNFNLSLSELVSKTVGQLTVLDCAKHVERKKQVPPTPVPTLDAELLGIIRQYLQVTESTAIHALTLIPGYSGAVYCVKVMQLNVLGSTPKGEWTPEDLGWEPVGEVPDYASQPSVVDERTGTIPFISHELMAGNTAVVHNAIHDLESFWWVIIYLCLTRESGGGHRRQSVPENVQHLVDNIFHNSSAIVGLTKALYFGKDGAVHFKELLELFSDYFEPLKPMLARWRSVLVLGYNHEAYEYHLIHKYVLAIIEDTLGTLPATEETSIVRNELKRREKEYAVIYNIDCLHFGRSRLSTGSMASPILGKR